MKRYYRVTDPSRIFYEPGDWYPNFDQALACRHYTSTTLLIYDQDKNLIKIQDIKTELEHVKIRSNEHWKDLIIRVADNQINWQNAAHKHNKFRQRLTKYLRQELEMKLRLLHKE